MDPKRKADMKQKSNSRIHSHARRDGNFLAWKTIKLKAQDVAQAPNISWEEFKGSCCFNPQMMRHFSFPIAENLTFPMIPFQLHQETHCIPAIHDQIP